MGHGVSVVMPTHNRGHALERVISPLLADPANAEVVVVVDGSSDDSPRTLGRLAKADRRVLPLFIEHRGEMGARQAGAEAACGDVVLFIDDDVLAEPGLVRGHARHHEAAEHLVVVGYMPVQVPQVRGPGEFATRLYAAEYEGRCRVYQRDPPEVLLALWGGNFSMRRTDCLAIGMHNPCYRERYHPDLDFGLRCVQAGLIGVFDRDLRAIHLHERSLAAFIQDARSQGAGRVMLHHTYPDLLGPLSRDRFETGVPRPVRPLVRAARRPRFHAGASAALRATMAAGARLNCWPLEDRGAKLLRRIEQQRGAISGSLPAH